MPQLAAALKNGVPTSATGDGFTWNVGVCGSNSFESPAFEINANSMGDTGVCQCQSPGWIVRPNLGNQNWGGAGTLSCGGPSQTLTVTFDDSSVGTLFAALAGGNLTVTDTSGVVNKMTVVVSGTNLVLTDATDQFQSAPAGGTLSNGNTTLTIPLASVTGTLGLNLAGGNDTLTVNYGGGNFPFAITYDGGAAGNDGLRVVGSGTQSANYKLSATTQGNGTITSAAGNVTFTGLEPIEISGMLTATLTLPGAADVLTLANGTDFFAGNATPAIRVSGTSGGVGIETAAFWNNGTLVIDTVTGGTDGNDTITITSANNAHANTNITISTGAGTDSVLVNGGLTVTGAAAVGTVNVSGAGAITTGSGLSVTNTGVASTLSGTISGAGTLVKNGTGTLTLTGTNTYTGATSETAGTLQVGNGGPTGSIGGTPSVAIAAAGTLLYNRNDSAGEFTIAHATSGAGAWNFTSPGGTQVGRYSPTGNNSAFSGTMAIANSRVAVNSPNQLGTATITVNAVGQISPFGGATFTNMLRLNSLGWVEAAGNFGAIRFQTGSVWAGPVVLLSNSAVGGNTGDTGSITGVISESGGSSGYTKVGAGTVTIAGAASNTYTGTTVVDNGTLEFAKTGGAVAVVGPVQMGGGNGNQPNLRMLQSNQFGPGVAMTFVNAPGGFTRFDLQGTAQTLAGIQGTTGGGVIQNERLGGAGTAAAGTLTFNGTASYTYDGWMRDEDDNGNVFPLLLVKNGTGTQTLSVGASGARVYYTGQTTVNGGTLELVNLNAAQGSPFNSSVAVNAPGVLNINTTVPFATRWNYGKTLSGNGTMNVFGGGVFGIGTGAPGVVTMSGQINVQAGKLHNDNLTANWTGSTANVNVSVGASLDLRANDITVNQLTGLGLVENSYGFNGANTLFVGVAKGSSTFSGTINGNGSGFGGENDGRTNLVKQGTGTVTLAGSGGTNNNATGLTTVNAGTLVVGGGFTGDGAWQGDVTINNTGTLQLAQSDIFNNSSDFTINAGGTFNMSGQGDAIGNIQGAGTVTNNTNGQGLYLDDISGTRVFSGGITGGGQLVLRGSVASGGSQVISGPSYTFANVQVGQGTLTFGNATAVVVPGVVNVGDNFIVGSGGTIVGTLNVTGGSLTASQIDIGNTGGAITYGYFNQTGGTVTTTSAAPPDGASLRAGHWGNGRGFYTLSGGTLSVSQNLSTAIDGAGVFTQTGGTATAAGVNVNARAGGGGHGVFNVRGGTFNVGANGITSDSGPAGVYLGGLGATLRATANWSSSLDMVLSGTGATAATIDTNGFTVTLSGRLQDAGVTGQYFSLDTFPNGRGAGQDLLAPLAQTLPIPLQGFAPAVANVITPRVDFGVGTEVTPGDGSVLDRNGTGGNPFGGTGAFVGFDQVAGVWTGQIVAPEAATYEFTTRSDDGSVLYVDGVSVVNNNFFQGMFNRSGQIALTAGLHTIRVGFYEGGGGAGVQASWAQLTGAAPFARRVIAPTDFFRANPTDTRLTKVGAGALLLNGSSTFAGTTQVAAGTLGGTGSITGVLTVSAAGAVNPGVTTGVFGTGAATFAAGSTYAINVNGLTVGTQYDRLNVTGAVTLGGSTLSLTGTHVPSGAVQQTFIIIANDGTDAVVGQFAGLSEGAAIILNGQQLFISYQGGDGNDVALNSQPAVAGTAGADVLIFTPISATSFTYQLNANPAVTATGTTAFTFNGLAGDDYMEVLVNGNALPSAGVFFNGGTQDFTSRTPNSVGDLLRVTGTVAGQTATYTPSATAQGDGTVAVSGGGTVTFSGLEPVDITGMATATLTLPNGADVLTVANGFDAAFGTTPALTVTGTSGGVAIERANFFGNTTVVINTTTVDGNDAVTIAGGNNAHANANVTIGTGVGTDAVTVTGNLTVTGTTSVSSQNIACNGGTLTAAAVTLNAGTGAITDANGTTDVFATNLALTATTGIGVGNTLETTVSNLEARTATGGIFVSNTGALGIGNVSGTLSGVQVTGATGNIQIDATGTLSVVTTDDVVFGPSNVTLNAIGAASDLRTAGNNPSGVGPAVGANGLITLSAGRDVLLGDAGLGYGDGYSGGSILVTAGRDFVLRQDSFLDVNGAGTNTVIAGRDIILFNDNSNSRLTTQGGAITLTANRNVVANVLGTILDTIDATQGGVAPAGANVTITATTGSILLGDGVNAGTAGNVTLSAAAGAITDTLLNGASRVRGNALTATAATGILLETAVNTVTSATTTGAGAIDLRELDAVTLTNVTTANGPITVTAGGTVTATNVVSSIDIDANDITITATAGNVRLGTVNAGPTAGDVTLTATAGSILDVSAPAGPTATNLVTGDVVTLTAAVDVGSAPPLLNINTTANTIVATTTASPNAGTHGIWINETNAVTIQTATTADGLIRIITGGNTSVGNVVANGTGRNTTVTATAGNITVTGTATSTLGNVTLTASAGNLTINPAATVVAGGTVTANVNKNLTVNGTVTATGAATLNFGTGGAGNTALLNAAITGAPATVLGGTGADAVTVTVVGTGSDLTVNGQGADDTYTVQFGGFTTTKILFVNDTGVTATDKAFMLGTAGADTFNVNSVANPNRVEVSGSRVQYAGAGAGGLEYLELSGTTGGDTYNVYFNGLVTPETKINAGSGSDAANLFGTTAGDLFNINSTTPQAVLALGEKVTYTAALEQLTVNGHRDPTDNPFAPTATDGSDTFTVTPDAVTAITINGGTPVQPASPGDTLILNALGLVNPVVSPNPALPNGQITSANKAAVVWRSIETFPVPLGLGGTFDFETTATQTQPGWLSVLPTDTVVGGAYSFANVGWVAAPNGFDRNGVAGYNPPAGPLSKLLRDGAWGLPGRPTPATSRSRSPRTSSSR